jgi:nucleotide-binding universal stress UspA family protein
MVQHSLNFDSVRLRAPAAPAQEKATGSFTGILVPLDLSESLEGAERAAEIATDIASRYGASLTFLYIFPITADDVPAAGAFAELARKIDGLQERALAAGSTDVSAISREAESTADAVLDMASEQSSKLIVMGTHRRRGLSHLLTGSAAERVMREAPCPVLLVPELEKD